MRRPLQVLIVDADDGDRKHLRDCVERAGIEAVVNETGSGADVAALYGAAPADCVLLDYFLPGETGLAVLAELKALDRHTPVVMTTRHGSEDVAVAALKAGAHDYVVKRNVSPQSIRRIITNVSERVAMLRKIDAQYEELDKPFRADIVGERCNERKSPRAVRPTPMIRCRRSRAIWCC